LFIWSVCFFTPLKQEDKKMGFLETLTIVFIVLKLTEVIAWSWWAVFSPMWVGYAVIFCGAMIVGAVRAIQEYRRN